MLSTTFLSLYAEKNFFECIVSLCQSNLPKEKDSLTKEKNMDIWVVIKMKITLPQCDIFCGKSLNLWTHLSSCAKWEVLASLSARPLTFGTLIIF